MNNYKEHICIPDEDDTVRKSTTTKAWGYFNFNTLLGTRRLRGEAYKEVDKILNDNFGIASKRMFNVRKVTISYE